MDVETASHFARAFVDYARGTMQVSALLELEGTAAWRRVRSLLEEFCVGEYGAGWKARLEGEEVAAVEATLKTRLLQTAWVAR